MMAGDLRGSIYTSSELTQIPIRDSIIIIIQFIIVILIFLYAITLMLLGDRTGAMETRPDVLLVVRNGLIFLNVPLIKTCMMNKICTCIDHVIFERSNMKRKNWPSGCVYLQRYICLYSVIVMLPFGTFPEGDENFEWFVHKHKPIKYK